jgi:hypothetical protein
MHFKMVALTRCKQSGAYIARKGNLLPRRADGNYSKDRRPAQFPKIAARAAGMTCWELFEAWAKERQPKPSTVDRRRGVFLHLQDHFGDRDISAITDQDAVKWKDGLLTPERSGRTVNDVWLVTVKAGRLERCQAPRPQYAAPAAADRPTLSARRCRRRKRGRFFWRTMIALIRRRM